MFNCHPLKTACEHKRKDPSLPPPHHDPSYLAPHARSVTARGPARGPTQTNVASARAAGTPLHKRASKAASYAMPRAPRPPNPNDELKLTDQQIAEFREAFSLFDKDGDGHVTLKELKIVFDSLGQNPTEEDLKAMIAEVDTDGGGEMEFEEVREASPCGSLRRLHACSLAASLASQFCKLMVRNMGKQEDEATLREAFTILDKDGSGEITADELKAVLNAFSQSGEVLNEGDIEAMIKEADVDGDGSISFDEVRMPPATTRPSRSPLTLALRPSAVYKGHDEGGRMSTLLGGRCGTVVAGAATRRWACNCFAVALRQTALLDRPLVHSRPVLMHFNVSYFITCKSPREIQLCRASARTCVCVT